MKEKVIKEIEQKMASILNNEQKEKLKEVLLYTFYYRVTIHMRQ